MLTAAALLRAPAWAVEPKPTVTLDSASFTRRAVGGRRGGKPSKASRSIELSLAVHAENPTDAPVVFAVDELKALIAGRPELVAAVVYGSTVAAHAAGTLSVKANLSSDAKELGARLRLMDSAGRAYEVETATRTVKTAVAW